VAYTTGSFGRVFFVKWQSGPEPAALAQLEQQLAAATKLAGPVSFLTVVQKDAPVPTSTERKALEAFALRIRPLCEHAYLVIEGEGFKASIQRSVIIGLTFFKERGYTSIYKTVAEALAAMAKRTGVDLDALTAAARTHQLV
jgi:hypothetical protein